MFGRIAACNALSDVYAMGGIPWCAMNIACFPAAMTEDCAGMASLRRILEGGHSALTEAHVSLAGGHSIQDDEIKYGLSVTGIIDPKHIASNDQLRAGLLLILTKPIGTGILSTGVKAGWEGAERSEQLICATSGRLNAIAGEAIRTFALPAATDITGFGLVGHALEMALASHTQVVLDIAAIPLLDNVLSYAEDGLVPQGAYRNRSFCQGRVSIRGTPDELRVLAAYDPQTSGGLLLGVPEKSANEVIDFLKERGEGCAVIGHVEKESSSCTHLILAG